MSPCLSSMSMGSTSRPPNRWRGIVRLAIAGCADNSFGSVKLARSRSWLTGERPVEVRVERERRRQPEHEVDQLGVAPRVRQAQAGVARLPAELVGRAERVGPGTRGVHERGPPARPAAALPLVALPAVQ